MGQLSQVISWKPSKMINFWIPLAVVVATGGILILMIFTTLIYQTLYLNRVYPGVSVMGISAGGLTQPALITAIEEHIPDYLERSITVEAGDQVWIFTAQELGLRINPTLVADEVFAVGRQGRFVSDLVTHLNLLTTPREVEPLLWYDSAPAEAALQKMAETIDFPPQDAQLMIHPDARIEVTPARRGRRLHREATRSALEAALFGRHDGRVTATIQEIIPAIPQVETARQQAETLLEAPLVFRAEIDQADPLEWVLEPEAVAELLEVVERVDQQGETQVGVELNLEKFEPYLEEFALAVHQDPLDPKIEFDDLLGKAVILEAGQDGFTLDMEALRALGSALIESESRIVDLPVLVTRPALSEENLDSLGIKQLVSEETSYFQGSSAGRMHNIALSASKFDGVLIPPNGIFSFNEHLGEVSKATGFDESLIIFGDRTTVGIGGGVCQVSTTVFRAAFFGGFELVERWAHGYRVGWYETNSIPGLDATIYTPDVDFRFRNDTDHYLLIETETDLLAGTVTFRFYGTPSNREVIVSEPEQTNLIKPDPPLYEEDPSLPKGAVKQVDWAKDGLDVKVTRIVKDGETIIYEDEIFSHYRPWRSVYKVGTGEG